MINPEFLHYLIITLTVAVPALSTALGQGFIGVRALEALDIQPEAKGSINAIALYGSALVETGAIMGVLIGIVLFMDSGEPINPYYTAIAQLGIVFALGLSSLVIGIVSSWPISTAALAVTRQPFMASKITQFMMISITMIQTPLILALIVSFLIKTQASAAHSLADAFRLLGSGCAIGIGCIGPVIGLALYAKTAVAGIGINRDAYARLLTFTFISQAIIETPIIFALVISFILLLVMPPMAIGKEYAMLAAGLTIGIGTIAAGYSSGKTAAATCKQITTQPENYRTLSKTSIFAQGLLDTNVIYALLISLGLLFFT